MPDLTVSDAIDTFMGSADQSAARANLGIAAIPFGLPETTFSNNTTDATNDIDFSAGVVVVRDGTNRIPVSFSALTKQLDAAWAAGDNAGGLDTGSKANSTWYYAFAIYNPTTDVKDFLFSLSATAPTLPSGFSCHRRVGSIQTQAGGAIRPFTQLANNFCWVAEVTDLNGVNVPTTDTLYSFTIPPELDTELLGTLTPGLANGSGDTLNVSMVSTDGTTNLDGNILRSDYRGTAGAFWDSAGAIVTHAHSTGWFSSTGQFKLRRTGTYFATTHQTTFQTTGFTDLSILRGL